MLRARCAYAASVSTRGTLSKISWLSTVGCCRAVTDVLYQYGTIFFA